MRAVRVVSLSELLVTFCSNRVVLLTVACCLKRWWRFGSCEYTLYTGKSHAHGNPSATLSSTWTRLGLVRVRKRMNTINDHDLTNAKNLFLSTAGTTSTNNVKTSLCQTDGESNPKPNPGTLALTSTKGIFSPLVLGRRCSGRWG